MANRIIILILYAIFCVSCIGQNENKQTNMGDLARSDSVSIMMVDSFWGDYSKYSGYIPEEGFVPNSEVAVKIAEAVLFEIYGEDSIREQRPYNVMLKDDIWYLEGHLPESMLGGVFYIEISKTTAQILKMLHGKQHLHIGDVARAPAFAEVIATKQEGLVEEIEKDAHEKGDAIETKQETISVFK